MKVLEVLVVVLSCTLFSAVSAQQNQLSVYLGGQIPSEVALLDFGGNGPADVFKAGVAAGLSVERNWKVWGIRGDLDFTTNGLKDMSTGFSGSIYDGNLYNMYLRTYLHLNVLGREGGPQLSLGVGPGVVVGSVPKTTFWIDVAGSDFIQERSIEVSLAMCSSIRLNIPISDNMSFYTALNNDFIVYYADIESVVYTNLNLGVTFMF